MSKYKIGIIGGQRLVSHRRLHEPEMVRSKRRSVRRRMKLLTGKLAGRDWVFLPRHARGP